MISLSQDESPLAFSLTKSNNYQTFVQLILPYAWNVFNAEPLILRTINILVFLMFGIFTIGFMIILIYILLRTYSLTPPRVSYTSIKG